MSTYTVTATRRPQEAPGGRHPIVRTAAIAILASSTLVGAFVQDFDQTSCDEFLVAPRSVDRSKVGPTACMMQETDVSLGGRAFRRLDMGLDGTVEGTLTADPRTREYFTNAPALVFPQLAIKGEPVAAIASYTGRRGASMTVVYPLDAGGWNGGMWVTAHGGDVSLGQGLAPWHRNLDRQRPSKDLNAYDRSILSKGYVVVKTRRPTVPRPGEISAKQPDGTAVDGISFKDTARYITDLTAVAERTVARRLGKPPIRTYFYGHGSGASIGRALNYAPGLNAAADGNPVFDGILADDAAAGLWLPGDASRDLVPHMDVVHQMHNAVWRAQKADHISMSALENARRNAVVLREKGLDGRARTYEIRHVSHDGGEALERDPATSYIELPRVMETLFERLDQWVTKGVEPPATRSDSARFGASSDLSAITLPEAACPLGAYHPWPGITGPKTAFTPFGSNDLEPLDDAGRFVDMNQNGIRDRRETLTQAWRRLGLLKPNEELTRGRFVDCVRHSVTTLRQDGFVNDATVQWYLAQAEKVQVVSASDR